MIDRAPAGLAARPARFDDLEPVVALFESYDREVVGDVEPRREFFRWIWALPHVDLDRDAVMALDPAGTVIGFGQTLRDPEAGGPFHGLGVVHPDHRGLGLGEWLLGSMDAVRSTLAPAEVLRNAIPAVDAAAAELLVARGYRHVRTSWDMTRALDGTWPDPRLEPGVTLRAFEVGPDEHLLHEIANEAFRDHWDHLEQTFEAFAAAVYEPDDWDPALASIAEVDGEPAGHLVGLDFAGMGYVASIGVLRPFRGRGIARAMLARAFTQLAARGHHVVELTVDAENPTGAVRLYEGMGMTVRRETHLYDSDPPLVNLPPGYTWRPGSADHLDDYVALFQAWDLADCGRISPVRDFIEDDLTSSASDPARDWRSVWTAEGSIAALAQVAAIDPTSSIETYVVVHPAHRERGLGVAALRWMEGRATELTPPGASPAIYNTTSSTDAAGAVLLARHGYRHVRTYWHMEARLDGDVAPGTDPAGVSIRTLRPEVDARALHETIEESFREEFGWSPVSYERWRADVVEAASFDPSLCFVAIADDGIVGGVLGRVMDDEGWIDELGVRERWRHRGIGEVLLRRSFAAFAARGMTLARLNVDSANETGAPRLYERVGMVPSRAWSVHEKRLPTG